MKIIESLKFKLISVFIMVTSLTACSFDNVIKFISDVGTVVKAVAIVVAWLPPAADLQHFDANLATQNLNAQNITITSTSGDVEFTIKDENDGTILGQRVFAYNVNAQGQVSFQNPTAVNTWVRSFSNYDGFVDMSIKTVLDIEPPPAGQQGTVSSTVVYNGSPVSSASATYINEGPVGCPPGTFCQEQ